MTPNQEQKLNEIHELLAGTLEKKGLVHVVRENQKEIAILKEYKRKDEKYKAKVAGGVFISIPIIGAIVEWFKYYFFSK